MLNYSFEKSLVSIQKMKSIWTENELSLGIPIIDLHHIWLIYLIQVLRNEIEGDLTEISNFRYISSELVNYISNHFSAEEALFKKFKYPRSKEHHIQHLRFIAIFTENSNFGSETQRGKVFKFLEFLEEWLYKHIKVEDKHFQNHYSGNILAVNTYLKLIIENRIVPITTLPLQISLYQKITSETFPIETNKNDIVSEVIKFWRSFKLGLGIPILDMHHLWLVKLTVELEFSLQKRTLKERKQVAIKIMDELLKYFQIHYYAEEEIMTLLEVENLEEHKLKHRKFEENIQLSMNGLANFENALIHDILIELKNWIVDHISSDDKIIKKLFRKDKDKVVQFVKKMIIEKKFFIQQSQLNLYSVIKEVMESQINE
ncbi:MAG: hemerythrin family protein [Leptospiraceae bacterium]|nr:hemerythrin family protein [Leptospiraceae bacterium]MCP5512024.1 hemerythrin family protein [Leptospiraceae bacterium]